MTVQTTADTVTVTIDGFEMSVPKGTLIIRAAEQGRQKIKNWEYGREFERQFNFGCRIRR